MIADNFKRNPKLKKNIELKCNDINYIIEQCRKALIRYPNAFNELLERVHNCNNYNEALSIIKDYVNII